MQESSDRLNELFEGLRSLAEGAFPKACNQCGKVYESLEGLLGATQPGQQSSELREVQQGASSQVEVHRICGCGADLSELFDDRRSTDTLGLKRRQLFDRLLDLLTGGGMPEGVAKKELIKVMRGEGSDLLGKDQLQRFFS